MEFLGFLLDGVKALNYQQVLMWIIGAGLIFLAIKKDYEPALLLPIGFGAILVNIPLSSMVDQNVPGYGVVEGIIDFLFNKGIATELFPLVLFVGIGAMIDFGPLLSNPKMLFFGAAAQFGIFGTLLLAVALGFDLKDAASIGIIGAADGPTSIYVANFFQSKYVGPIMVAAYSYMSLVPIIQPFAIKLVTTKKERMIRMPYKPKQVSKTTRILFPIGVSLIAGLIAPSSLSLIGMLMFGNLIRESGVLNSLSKTAQSELANLVTLFLGITIASKMQAADFITIETLVIIGLG
ncbi:MAG: sodium ion-translocating decarboxylase subunit beta, partial [Eubacteriales bacterium]|nr:sodium ion-translocating decarboxylase subunit beta [Eubacteriales bacterium]